MHRPQLSRTIRQVRQLIFLAHQRYRTELPQQLRRSVMLLPRLLQTLLLLRPFHRLFHPREPPGETSVVRIRIRPLRKSMAVPFLHRKLLLGRTASSQIVDASSATLSNNTTGTAANLSGTPALPNGTTATEQAAG